MSSREENIFLFAVSSRCFLCTIYTSLGTKTTDCCVNNYFSLIWWNNLNFNWVTSNASIEVHLSIKLKKEIVKLTSHVPVHKIQFLTKFSDDSHQFCTHFHETTFDWCLKWSDIVAPRGALYMKIEERIFLSDGVHIVLSHNFVKKIFWCFFFFCGNLFCGFCFVQTINSFNCGSEADCVVCIKIIFLECAYKLWLLIKLFNNLIFSCIRVNCFYIEGMCKSFSFITLFS